MCAVLLYRSRSEYKRAKNWLSIAKSYKYRTGMLRDLIVDVFQGRTRSTTGNTTHERVTNKIITGKVDRWDGDY